MGKLTDLQIQHWIKSNQRFNGKSDGDGLYLCYRKEFAAPRWLFRYRIAGKARTLGLGTYGTDLSLADARKQAKQMRARVTLGFDVAAEKQDRKRAALKKIDEEKFARTVGQLADEYFTRMILGHWKHPNIVRSRIAKDIKPRLGKLRVGDVRPMHIDAMLRRIVARGAPTVANDVLRWTRRIFDFAIKRHLIIHNPAAAFDLGDAGGREEARERWLTQHELTRLFEAMRQTKGFTVQNYLAVKLLLLLAVRKQELTAARTSEFDLPRRVWHLPEARTKTSAAIDIPLPPEAVECLRQLIDLSDSSDYLLPARKRQDRMLPHIHENTLNVAMVKVQTVLAAECIPAFTIHDFRRTARTHMSALGVEPHVAERCLNHRIQGVAGVYDRHDYIEKRRAALETWARLLHTCEHGGAENVIPIKAFPAVA